MSKVYVNDGYMMLLDAIYFNGKRSAMFLMTVSIGAVMPLNISSSLPHRFVMPRSRK